MTEKPITIVDEDDNVVGEATWKEAHDKGLIFRAANVLVFNSKGELFVHKRSSNLPTFLGMYDMKLGGVVDAGESYEETAKRELKEEAGIENVKLEFLFSLKFRKNEYKVNRLVYKCIYDGEMTLQEEEIEFGKFMTLDEVKNLRDEGKLSAPALSVLEEFLKRK